jgi:hypothetical protein
MEPWTSRVPGGRSALFAPQSARRPTASCSLPSARTCTRKRVAVAKRVAVSTVLVLTAEECTKKRRAPGGGVGFIREVVDPQSRSPCFSDDDDKPGVCVFPWKNASRFEAKSLHDFAFLPEEAAKQEVSEEIRPALFSRWLMKPVREGCSFVMFLAHLPIFLNGCHK